MDKKKKNSSSQSNPNKDKSYRERSIAAIRAMEGEGNERKFILSFSSEEPYLRRFGSEILDHSEGAIDLTRINEIGCLLFNHKRDAVVGKINRAWIENGRGQAEVEFDDTDEESEKIYQKVKNGTLKGVSIGYVVDEWEEVPANRTSSDGRFRGPCSIAKRWTPFEISIVSVPADPTVGVGREMGEVETRQQETGKCYLSHYERQLQINLNTL